MTGFRSLFLRHARCALLLAAAAALAAADAGCARQRKQPEPSKSPPSTGASTNRSYRAANDTTGGSEAAAAHILIQYQGCANARPGVTRARWEAEDLARRLTAEAREPGSGFAGLARRWSDDPDAGRTGGYLGIFRHGQLELPFEVALFALRPGEVGNVVETDYGWHVIQRLPVRRASAHHILIAWRGAERATAAVTRTKEQAQALAEEVRLRAAAPGADLCRLAQQFSDDPESATKCGALGVIEPGFLPAALDEELFRLRPGAVSAVTESPFGFHVLWREP